MIRILGQLIHFHCEIRAILGTSLNDTWPEVLPLGHVGNTKTTLPLISKLMKEIAHIIFVAGVPCAGVYTRSVNNLKIFGNGQQGCREVIVAQPGQLIKLTFTQCSIDCPQSSKLKYHIKKNKMLQSSKNKVLRNILCISVREHQFSIIPYNVEKRKYVTKCRTIDWWGGRKAIFKGPAFF